MAIRPIVTHPHEVLRKKAHPVRKISRSIEQLLEDMWDTMYDAPGIGLAAPQIGVAKRVIVVDVGDDQEPLELINPIVVYRQGRAQDWEGCLSLPQQFGLMERAVEVKVRAMNRSGQTVMIHAKDLLARALQHEIDHLDGVLLFDHAVSWEDTRETAPQQQGSRGGDDADA